VQRAGDRILITAQLVEAATGRHVWVERYRHVDDLFAVMDNGTGSIVDTLGTTYGASPKLPRLQSLHSGMQQLNQFTNIALNPRYAKGHSKIAWALLCDMTLGGIAQTRPFR